MSDSLRATHDELLATLSRRQSIFHFAHAAVSLFVCFIASGAAWRLSLDTEYAWAPGLVLPAQLIAGAALCYGVVRLVLGRGRLVVENEAFAELKRLRAQLKLDEAPVLERA
ncbi:MAG: hypothetical protein SFW67_33930 [Myxococcaceae bacterium]|nr:hypothetical protein [Myxococcaceae bacterium]